MTYAKGCICKTLNIGFSERKIYVLECIPVRQLLERMSKTLFFRSGGEALILTEEQREARKLGEALPG